MTHVFKAYTAFTTEDIEWWAKTLYAEAGSEPFGGKLGVAYVIYNRASIDIGGDNKPDWWGETIKGVCLKGNDKGVHQFSCWNTFGKGQPEYGQACARRPWTQLGECLEAIARVLTNGPGGDPTKGATHYYADYIPTPVWATPESRTTKLGRHIFHKLY